jgi:hypothetical protein
MWRRNTPVVWPGVLIEQRFRGGIQDGSITLTFRRWKRRQVVAGHRYRTTAGIIEVDAVDVVDDSAITAAGARTAGYPSVDTLVADLRGTPELPLYRVRFHHVGGPDPRDELAATDGLSADEVAELARRLARLDRASKEGPWTATTLRTIASRPGQRAADLAASLGRDTAPFKLDVRKLKNLGLTLSLDVGYRLSARGESYLSSRQAG